MEKLIDAFLPALAFASLLGREPELRATPYATARADMDGLLDGAMEAAGKRSRPEDAENALFAACAFADETVLASEWSGRGEWLRRTLQRERFRTVNAGEEFYARLSALLEQARPGGDAAGAPFGEKEKSAAREVLEVYAACLTLGFAGRYYGEDGREKLSAITRESLDELLVRPPALDAHLFPEAYSRRAPAPPPPRWRRGFVLAAAVAVPALTALYLHAAYASLLTAWVRDWFRGLGC